LADGTECAEKAGVIEVVVTRPRDLEREAGLLFAALSPPERGRATLYRQSADRSRFVIGRGLLRTLLARRLAVAPGSLRIEAGPFGKPALAGGPEFSVSHSGSWIAIAVSDTPVGIDIETRSPLDHLPLSLLSYEERERVRRATDPLDVFLSIWVAKEAVLKVDGRGLGGDIADFTVPATPYGRPVPVAGKAARSRGIAVMSLSLSGEVHCAVAARGDAWTAEVRHRAVGSGISIMPGISLSIASADRAV
jgi:4'-phosphopantetheinyl transferase